MHLNNEQAAQLRSFLGCTEAQVVQAAPQFFETCRVRMRDGRLAVLPHEPLNPRRLNLVIEGDRVVEAAIG